MGAANAADTETIDMAAINAARTRMGTSTESRSKIFPMIDPPPLLAIRGRIGGKSTIDIPRVGYSLYKTPLEQAERCTALALRSGVRHFDVASLYGSNEQVARVFKKYLDVGIAGIDMSSEKPELLELLDTIALTGDKHSNTGGVTKSILAPTPNGSAGRRGRREGLFVSHKISNAEQSTDKTSVTRAVKSAIATLGTGHLDLVSIHSPLTDTTTRLETYTALLELRDSGFVKSVGVCNYGLGPLKEIENAGLEPPAIIQLELSPFNGHNDVIEWSKEREIAMCCGAWSKLSGADGPQDGWAVLSDIAKKKGMTRAQILVRWSLQKGYVCVPRSSVASKVERIAIAENSYGGVNSQGGVFVLTNEEMRILDGLDEHYKAGKLGRRDGWGDDDVAGPEWDPTDFI
jgi:diketogulonate reductase-like aldo/keto reductase